jgi:hypothetical protein
MKKIKTEEYLISQIYTLSEEKNNAINSSFFNNSKSSILSKMLNQNNKEEKENEFKHKTLEDDEEQQFIKRDNIKKSMLELFINRREMIFHKIYTKKLNKGVFIENIIIY